MEMHRIVICASCSLMMLGFTHSAQCHTLLHTCMLSSSSSEWKEASWHRVYHAVITGH